MADHAAHNAAAYQAQQTLMSELEKMLVPAPQPPEPTVVVVESADGSDELGTRDFNHERWMQKSRSWW